MKRSWIIIGVIVILVLIVYGSLSGKYNQMISLEEGVKTQWANVETQYQRRTDLIPNLVNTVKGFAQQEQEVLTQVTEARSRAGNVQIDPTNLNASNLQQFQQAQTQLSSALSRLMVVVERYPELKSNQNFLELQAQLEGTENRIAVERRRFNESVQDYNTYIRSFPNNMMASMFGFEVMTQFASEEGADQAPEVTF